MKVFISWSGKRSHAMALALKDWLPVVLQSVEPWVSSEDLRSGGRWALELSAELEGAKFGIACLTSDNLESKWLHFEAGAISKEVGETFLAPLLLDIAPSDVSQPLGAFQAVEANEDRILKLLKDIRDAGKLGVADAVIERLHKSLWPELHEQFQAIGRADSQASEEPGGRDDRELLEEILEVVRGLAARTVPSEGVVDAGSLSDLLNRLRHEPARPVPAFRKVEALRRAQFEALAEALPCRVEEMHDEQILFVHARPGSLDTQHVDALDEYAQRYGMSIAHVHPTGR